MPTPILRLAVPAPLPDLLDYLPPPGVDAATLAPGQRLRVPLGRRVEIGLLVELATASDLPVASLRPALERLDDAPLVPEDLLRLGQWGARYYHHPPGEVFATLLPTLLRQGQPAAYALQQRLCISDAGRAVLAAGQLTRAPRQRALLEQLAATPHGLPRDALGGSSAALRALLDHGHAVEIEVSATPPSAGASTATSPALSLAGAQAAAVAAIIDALGEFRTLLVEGVTGSGKTEVYLQAAAAALARGTQVLVLVPEIGLTPQLVSRFRQRLDAPLVVLHSGLNDRQRLDAWLAARDGDAAVIIGTRSAVFTPLARPGLLLIDEEHDGSLKQQDGWRYHARDLALVRARDLGIPVVLGSATPALETLHNAGCGRYRWLRLPERAGGAHVPRIHLIDVRRQTMQAGLSPALLEAARAHLARDEQVLLFLNRRGYAPALLCHECGWVGRCQRCDARLTLHLARRRLQCHHCGADAALRPNCPDCGSIDLRALGQGTERLEEFLHDWAPEVPLTRIDRDTTRRRGSLESLLEEVHRPGPRWLVGTQMLAKGHHFPRVTLVGIVDADQGLFSADFRATERMAQLIVQVAGRAGRDDLAGTVLIQTHHPDHPLLNTLVHDGYPAFATLALEERRAAALPPYAHQALLRAEAADARAAHAFLERARAIAPSAPGVELLGPVPAPMERRAGRYRAQLLLQAAQRATLHPMLGGWLPRVAALPEARRCRWSLDVDPQDLL